MTEEDASRTANWDMMARDPKTFWSIALVIGFLGWIVSVAAYMSKRMKVKRKVVRIARSDLKWLGSGAFFVLL